MPPHGLIAIAALGFCLSDARAADATTPIDYTQRNTPYAPNGTLVPDRQAPATNQAVQEKRLETATVEKKSAPQSDRRARVEMKETKEKQLREMDSHRPEAIKERTSRYNHREAAVSTRTETSSPPLVAKYQDRLTAATATNMARFPAIERATSAKLNRFVFRKNPEEPGTATSGAAVIPAAGGAADRK